VRGMVGGVGCCTLCILFSGPVAVSKISFSSRVLVRRVVNRALRCALWSSVLSCDSVSWSR